MDKWWVDENAIAVTKWSGNAFSNADVAIYKADEVVELVKRVLNVLIAGSIEEIELKAELEQIVKEEEDGAK